MQRSTYTIVDTEALRHNILEVRKKLAPGTRYMAVVKADAYGHGMVPVSKAALQADAEYIGVAIPEEGIELREAGITAPILVFGGLLPVYAETLVRYDLCATLFHLPMLHALQKAAGEQGKVAKVHVKVDTGMNRVGLKTKEELQTLLEGIEKSGRVSLEGLFTHFAVSELEDKSFTLMQLACFREMAALAKQMGFAPILHASNSGGALDLPLDAGLDMVRGGISMYGYYPGPGCGAWARLRPVLSWKTAIVYIKEVAPGETVSYGRRYTAKSTRRVATLPVGYGDGYHRCMSGRAQVLLHGRRAPVLGTICMDQLMVDVTDIPEAAVGDEVFLIGGEGPEAITADDLAQWADTISYEILLAISARVPRLYSNGEQEV